MTTISITLFVAAMAAATWIGLGREDSTVDVDVNPNEYHDDEGEGESDAPPPGRHARLEALVDATRVMRAWQKKYDGRQLTTPAAREHALIESERHERAVDALLGRLGPRQPSLFPAPDENRPGAYSS